MAVMIFYSIGKWLQNSAVSKAKRSIKALLYIRPDEVTVLRNRTMQLVHPNQIQVDEIIQVKPREKVALNGALNSDAGTFNTAALTRESKPGIK